MEITFEEIKRKPFDEIITSYKFIENISSGSFGTVIRAIQLKTGKEVAMKIINKSSKKIDTLKIKEEVNILKELKHPNILKYYDYIETNLKLYIIMEDLKGGTLRKWINENIKEEINEEKISLIIKNILSAVSYLHSKNICHRDLKLDNIMFKNILDLNTIKLIDFGLSVKNFDNYGEKDYCGTFIYMAPEQLENKIYSKIIDEWSIGIILFELLNKGNHPFYKSGYIKNKNEYLKKIKKKEIKFYNKISKMAEDLIKKLLEPDPLIRINAKIALNHPWITRNFYDPIPLNLYQKIIYSNICLKISDLILIMIFLNHFSKNNIFNNCKKIFYLNESYIKKVNIINNIKKEKFKRERMKLFYVENENIKSINYNYKIETTRNYKNENYLSSTNIDNNNNKNSKHYIDYNSKSTIDNMSINREHILPSLIKKTFYKNINVNNKKNDVKSLSSRKTDISKDKEDSLRKKDISKEISDTTEISLTKRQNIFIKKLKFLSNKNLEKNNNEESLPLIIPKNYNLNNSESFNNSLYINKEKNSNSISPYKGIIKKNSYKKITTYKKNNSSSMQNIHLYIKNPIKLFDSEKKENSSLNISKFIGKNNLNLFPIKFQNLLNKQKIKENPKLYFIKKENIKIDKNYIVHNYEIK
jgi:serine/threonine protein kinase